MQRLSTFEIRKLFLDYFQERGHRVVDSSSLVPADDPTLLFVNAGMVQFKDVFLGLDKRAYRRASTSQKCLRVSGKHNDLENVGPSPRHHTFFEMLGNFSFGDYFKKEAIEFAWDLLVNRLGLSLDRLWFSVYTEDDEAEELWKAVGAPAERILRFGKKDNWWEMGDVGPCGPCSEIHYYWGDPQDQVAEGVNVNDEYLEIWNLVFMQYEQREPNGELIPLPRPSVDTGMGLERIASILQGKDNNYDTDAFTPIMDRIQDLLGHSDAQRREHLVGYRVIADHGRSVAFLISDGVMPDNEGRDYVVRMILRRAARFGRQIGFTEPFLAEICQRVIDEYGTHYADLHANASFILETVTAEEERFQRALRTGLSLLDGLMRRLRAAGACQIAGEDAFRLWDTYGFPLDITRDVARESGFSVDEEGYHRALEQQRRQSGGDQQGIAADLSVYVELLEDLRDRGRLGEAGVHNLVFEDTGDADATVIGIVRDGRIVAEAHAGQEVEIVLPETPFYVESGGQVGDTGEIQFFPEEMDRPAWSVAVASAQRPIPGLVVHAGKVARGSVQVGDPAYAEIDVERRWDIMRNHTATHLLHAELRSRLGEHVRQRGSLVAPDRLRFDFSHPQPVGREELRAIEQAANRAILANFQVTSRWTDFDRAVAEGALAFFEERYGDSVRVVSIGEGEELVSQELCGGTHVGTTGEIGPLVIASEGSSAAGVRRIEALTGRSAQELLANRMAALDRVAAGLRVQPEEAATAVQRLQEHSRQLERQLEQTRGELARQQSESLLSRAVRMKNLSVLAQQVEARDVETLRRMTDWFRNKLGSSVVVLGSVIDEKPMLVAAATDEAIESGVHAGDLVRAAARVVGGGGGGRPNMAQAGGRHPDKLSQALGQVAGWVEESLG